MASKVKLMDDVTLNLITRAKKEDDEIINGIALDRKDIEFKYLHTERLNNWRTDELYIRRAQETETNFLEKIYDEEHATFLARQSEEASEQTAIENDRKVFGQIMSDIIDLKLQSLQNRAAADMRKSAKKTVKERRQAVRDRLARLDIRQERERRSLVEAHARKLKDIKLSRNITLRDIEDPELRIIISGKEYNDKAAAAENVRLKALKAEETKMTSARLFNQLVRNTKEIEQLREIHLLKLKHTTKYCDTELEFIDEHESLFAVHTFEEQKLEAELKTIADKEDTALQSEMTVARVKAHQAEAAHQSAMKRSKLKKDARQLKKKMLDDAKERERLFWASEEQALREHLIAAHGSHDQKRFEEKANLLLDRSRLHYARMLLEREVSEDEADMDDYLDESILESAAKMVTEASAFDKLFAKEMFRIENMRKIHRDQVQKLKVQNKKYRENLKKTQSKALSDLLEEQEQDLKKMMEQQDKELRALIESQDVLNANDQESKIANDRMSISLPSYVVDTLKENKSIEPNKFQNLVFLSADIVNLSSVSSEGTPQQVIGTLTTLYSAMDEIIGSFTDVYKMETFGDVYTVVAGVNSQNRSPKLNAIDIVECSLMFLQAVKNLEGFGNERLEIRLGIHTGSAIGGVTSNQTKFSLFGEGINTTALIGQSSKSNAVHISGATYDLVKDDYEFDVSETLTVENSGTKTKISTYWLTGRKASKDIGGKLVEKKVSMSRTITFDQ